MGCFAAGCSAAGIPRCIERVQMGNKQIIGAVVLVIVIVAAGIWIGRSMRAPGMPLGVAGEMVKKIDFKTMEVVEQTRAKWLELHGKLNLYKNPKTGEYTVVDMMKCASCGADIPILPMTDELFKKGFPAIRQAETEYKCPKCGKSPFSGR